MSELDDPRLAKLKGGYRTSYDARQALQLLWKGECAVAWQELWNHLHHQGDVGEASYAAVPHLVRIGKQVCPEDWNLYSLVSIIEVCRHEPGNPPLPEWLRADYERAWVEIAEMAIGRIASVSDENLGASFFAVIALHKKQHALARFALLSEDERKTALDELGWA
jgi:hypothetical protein